MCILHLRSCQSRLAVSDLAQWACAVCVSADCSGGYMMASVCTTPPDLVHVGCMLPLAMEFCGSNLFYPVYQKVIVN